MLSDFGCSSLGCRRGTITTLQVEVSSMIPTLKVWSMDMQVQASGLEVFR